MFLSLLILLAATDPASTPIDTGAVQPDSAQLSTASPSSDTTAPATDGLVAGRPGFTESRGVVQPGVVQFEGGYAATHDRTGGFVTQTSAAPGAVIRVGLGDRVELRAANVGVTEQTETTATGRTAVYDVSDVQVGAKILVVREGRAPLELAIIPMLSIPLSTDGRARAAYDPSCTVAMGRALPAGFDATGTFRAVGATTDQGRSLEYSGSVSISHSIAGGWSGSSEVFATPDPSTGMTTLNLGMAVSRLLGRRAQIDIDVGHSLSHWAPMWTYGAGLVFR